VTKAGGDNRIGKERLMKVSHHPGSEEEARSLGAGAGVAEGEEPRAWACVGRRKIRSKESSHVKSKGADRCV